MSRRVLVCGGRNYADEARVRQTLDLLDDAEPISVIIHGGTRGADQLAERWAADATDFERINVECYEADWKSRGRAAGPERNARMIAEGKPDLVVAFPGGRGTADMVRRAKVAGVPVLEIKP